MLDASAGLLTSARSRSALEEPAKMDLCALISVLSVMHCWMFCTVLSAPATVTPTAPTVPTVSTRAPERHVRTKRCSCATFMDKECVYFCHLDIIWVNTPERVVSYGLGNAPRTRRALSDSMVTGAGPRCACLRENDETCGNFCRPRSDAVIRSAEGDGCAGAQCGRGQAADTSRTRRVMSGSLGRVSPGALRAALKTRLLLEKWRVRRRHRARAWEGESAAS